jgi:alpha-L-fucosidase
MDFEPTIESLSKHEVPAWFHDAKLGIFIHWGLYSVPAWAPLTDDIQTLIKEGGLQALMSGNPYAEWYYNSMRIPEHPTCKHHGNTYGSSFDYFDFQKIFEEASAKMDADQWATLFKESGAKYVVMVTKHHDGYPLWPTRHPSIKREGYFAKRDLVGDVTEAVRAKGLKMGHYYSGVLDWTFNPGPIRSLFTFLTNQHQSAEYIKYASDHWYEIIDRYATDILWNDIGYPYGGDTNRLFADYYKAVPEGVVNDRWNQVKIPDNSIGRFIMKLGVDRQERKIRKGGHFEMKPDCHHDYRTPEYASYGEIQEKKWESCRGIGNSFGYNQLEPESRMLSGVELVRSLSDIVSKNGNLLLNVGPMADGTIPEMQQKPLKVLGGWLSKNGDAIFGTRPWVKPETVTAEGNPVSFTRKGEYLYAVVHEKIGSEQAGTDVVIKEISVSENGEISLLGSRTKPAYRQEGPDLRITLPGNVPDDESAFVFKIRGAKEF